jgi:hypothetical protein
LEGVLERKQFFLDLWAEREDGRLFYPYKGVRGDKKVLYSVNFTNDTNNFEGLSEVELIEAIMEGRFAMRGTIRMLPLDAVLGADRNAYAPTHYRGELLLKADAKLNAILRRSMTVFPDELPTERLFSEGAVRQILVNAYERSADARKACIAHHGVICKVCSINFSTCYGEIGFIHVHHLRMISGVGSDYIVDPVRDLIPVCPNCHAMLHSIDPPFGIEELRQRYEAQKLTRNHNDSIGSKHNANILLLG